MTNEQLDALEALAKDATPGEWTTDGETISVSTPHGSVDVLEMPKIWKEGSEWTGGYSTATGRGADLAFAAAAHPQTVLALIARIRELQNIRPEPAR